MRRAFANVAASTTDGLLTDPSTGLTTAAKAGFKYRVYAVAIIGDDTATDITFRNVGSTAISPLLAFGSSSGISLPYNPQGWFETASGAGLGVTTGTGATQGVLVTCELIPGDAS